MSQNQSRPFSVVLLIILAILLGLGGVGGGLGFLSDPSGAGMGMTIAELDGSPFPDYLIPGLFLFAVLGLFPFVVAFALWQRPVWSLFDRITAGLHVHWAWGAAVLLSVILIAWIVIEVMIIDYHWLQVLFGAWGAVMLILALLPSVRRYYAGA